MKILHVNGARSWGGNEQQLVYLVRGLNRKGIKQAIFCYEANPLLDIFESHEISIFKSPFIKPHKYAYWKSFKAAVHEFAPDIIHIHTGNSLTGYVLTDLFFNLKPKVIFSKKGISRNMSFLSRLKYNYRKVEKIICVSERVQQDLDPIISKKNKNKLEIVWDGVEEKQWPPVSLPENLKLPANAFIIGNIGNHTRSKDLKTLINTANYLVNHKCYTNFHFIQIGRLTGLTDELREMIQTFQLESNVHLMGFQENASAYFSNFDLFLMSSKKEGGPTSVLEAMIYKTPVVTTNVGMVPHAIAQSQNGFYAEPGQHEDLGNFIEKLYQDKELAKSFIEKSYHICREKFSVEQLTTKTLKIYKHLG